MNATLKDRTVLITGAAGGLGSALALALAREGAHLLLLDKNSRGLDQLSDRIAGLGEDLPGLCPLDLSMADPEAFDQVAALLREEFGGLDHLVHCAVDFKGLWPLDQIGTVDWLQCMQVNVNAAWLLTARCLPLLRESAAASVTFLLEDAKEVRSAYRGAYGVSKAATEALAAILEEELEGSGVRVFAVNPGPMRTALRASAYFSEHPESQPDPSVAAEQIIGMLKD